MIDRNNYIKGTKSHLYLPAKLCDECHRLCFIQMRLKARNVERFVQNPMKSIGKSAY